MLEKEINFNDIPNSILQVNNTFSEFIPALADEEFAQLEQNILADGIREPVCIWNGVIIDGHNRYTIARKHNLPFNTCEMNFEDENQAKMWIIKNQLGRRNIFDYSRGELALQLKDMFAAEAKKN
jgi:ParB-like chromosome segregation protein Spo0J